MILAKFKSVFNIFLCTSIIERKQSVKTLIGRVDTVPHSYQLIFLTSQKPMPRFISHCLSFNKVSLFYFTCSPRKGNILLSTNIINGSVDSVIAQ